MKRISCLFLCLAVLTGLICSGAAAKSQSFAGKAAAAQAKPGEGKENALKQTTTATAAMTQAVQGALPKADSGEQASEPVATARLSPTALAPDCIRYYPMVSGGRPEPTLIGSKAELDAFAEEYFDGSEQVSAALSKYVAEYFTEFDLALVCLTESSGSVSHKITGTRVEGGKLVVEIEATAPPVGTCDMAEWLIVTSCGKGHSGVEAEVSRKTTPFGG